MFDPRKLSVGVEGRVKLLNRWRPAAVEAAVVGALENQLDGLAEFAGRQRRRDHLITEQPAAEATTQVVL